MNKLISFRTVFQGYISVRLERGQPGPGGDGGGAGRGHAAAPLHARGDGNCRDDDQVAAVSALTCLDQADVKYLEVVTDIRILWTCN